MSPQQNTMVTRQNVLSPNATPRTIGANVRYCLVWFTPEEPPEAVVGDFWLQV